MNRNDSVETTERPEPLLRAKEVAQHCGGVCPHTLRRWGVPCVRINRRVIRYRLSEVLAYLERGGAQQAADARQAGVLGRTPAHPPTSVITAPASPHGHDTDTGADGTLKVGINVLQKPPALTRKIVGERRSQQ